jgi:hypothetical protein
LTANETKEPGADFMSILWPAFGVSAEAVSARAATSLLYLRSEPTPAVYTGAHFAIWRNGLERRKSHIPTTSTASSPTSSNSVPMERSFNANGPGRRLCADAMGWGRKLEVAVGAQSRNVTPPTNHGCPVEKNGALWKHSECWPLKTKGGLADKDFGN